MESFESVTLAYEDWSHEVRERERESELCPLSQAHLRMAWNYINEHGPENAIPFIKQVNTIVNILRLTFDFSFHFQRRHKAFQ